MQNRVHSKHNHYEISMLKEKMKNLPLSHYAARRATLDYDSFFDRLSKESDHESLLENPSKAIVRWLQKNDLPIILQ